MEETRSENSLFTPLNYQVHKKSVGSIPISGDGHLIGENQNEIKEISR
jgi:hypothetical protein